MTARPRPAAPRPPVLTLERLDDRVLPAGGWLGLHAVTGTLDDLLGAVAATRGLPAPVTAGLGPVAGNAASVVADAVSRPVTDLTNLVTDTIGHAVTDPVGTVTDTAAAITDTANTVTDAATDVVAGSVTGVTTSVPAVTDAGAGIAAVIPRPPAGAGRVTLPPLAGPLPGGSILPLGGPPGSTGGGIPTPADPGNGLFAAVPAAGLPDPTRPDAGPARQTAGGSLDVVTGGGGVLTIPLPVPPVEPTADRVVTPAAAALAPAPPGAGRAFRPEAVTRVEAPAPAEVPLPPAVAPDPVQAAAVPEAAPPTLAAAVPTAPLAAPAPADAPETPSLISRFLPFDTASLREGVNRVFAALNPGLPAFEEWSPADWASVAAALAAGAGAAYLARGRQTRRAARHARVRIA